MTCARIILLTWCANWRPHAHMNGTSSGECRIADSLNEGAASQRTSVATESGKGSRKRRGEKGLWAVESRCLKTLM